MAKPLRSPCVLSIGGLDPGGGAGLLADARAVARAGAFACGAAAVLTVQSTSGLSSARALPTREVVNQAREVLDEQDVRAIKTGALGSATTVSAVAELAAIHRGVPLVVDTVMLPTRGRARLLDAGAVRALKRDLLERAAVATVNAPEAEALTGRRVVRTRDARDAAERLLETGARAVLVKGGHLAGPDAIDFLATRRGVVELREPRLKLPPTHGGGCVLAALVAGRLAVKHEAFAEDPDDAVERAVVWARDKHHAALRALVDVGGAMRVLAFD